MWIATLELPSIEKDFLCPQNAVECVTWHHTHSSQWHQSSSVTWCDFQLNFFFFLRELRIQTFRVERNMPLIMFPGTCHHHVSPGVEISLSKIYGDWVMCPHRKDPGWVSLMFNTYIRRLTKDREKLFTNVYTQHQCMVGIHSLAWSPVMWHCIKSIYIKPAGFQMFLVL